MGYTRQAINGISWVGILRFLAKAVGFIEAIILARILVPAQFGAYGIALLMLGLLEMLTETGVNIVLIQERETDQYINSAWVVSIGRGVFISLLLFISAPFIASFFHAPDSLILLYLISFAPLLRGFINPAVVKLQKELLFKKNFYYQSSILIVDTLISIVSSYILKQPIGIILGLLAGVIVELAFSYTIVKPIPTFNFNRQYISHIFHRGKWVTLSGIFDYLFFNSDNIAVGKLLGTTSLGIYQMAYSLCVIPLTELNRVFVQVTFPIFVRIAEDKTRLKKAYIKMVIAISLLSVPYVILIIFMPELFVVVLGKKWADIVSVVPVLGALGLVKAISGSSSALFLSEKKQNYTMGVTFITIVSMIILLVPFISLYGIVGAGLAALIGSIIAVPLIVYYIINIFRERKS